MYASACSGGAIAVKEGVKRLGAGNEKKVKKKKKMGIDKKDRFLVYSSTLATNETTASATIFENKGKGKKIKPKSKIFGKEDKRKQRT